MNQPTIYTAGYTGKLVQQLVERACSMDALVLDVRLAPRSRSPAWNKGPLTTALDFRYRHVPALGNQNYKNGGPVAVQDMTAGIAEVEAALRNYPAVILLCVCKETANCHRGVIAEALRAEGHRVEDLAW